MWICYLSQVIFSRSPAGRGAAGAAVQLGHFFWPCAPSVWNCTNMLVLLLLLLCQHRDLIFPAGSIFPRCEIARSECPDALTRLITVCAPPPRPPFSALAPGARAAENLIYVGHGPSLQAVHCCQRPPRA